jgi:hypothetical protein
MGNNQSYTSLTTLPSEGWDNPRYVSYGVIVTQPESDDKQVVTKAVFPEGWTIDHKGDYNTTYFDPEGYPRFSTSYKDTDYDKWAHVNFFTDEESDLIKSQMDDELREEQLKKDFYDSLPMILDDVNQYVVFEYREADMYELKRGGYENHKDEFDNRELICTGPDVDYCKDVITDIRKNGFSDCDIVIRHAPHGFKSLSRFEISQLFGRDKDPCLINGTYSNCHHPKLTGYREIFTA